MFVSNNAHKTIALCTSWCIHLWRCTKSNHKKFHRLIPSRPQVIHIPTIGPHVNEAVNNCVQEGRTTRYFIPSLYAEKKSSKISSPFSSHTVLSLFDHFFLIYMPHVVKSCDLSPLSPVLLLSTIYLYI